jgi:hypothetical protein
VVNFQKRLKDARQVVLVGNGGIATELVCEIENCKIIWSIKDKYSCNHLFFDEFASKFFQKRIHAPKKRDEDKLPTKRAKYSISSKIDFFLYTFVLNFLMIY